jgi:hypothetical protein
MEVCVTIECVSNASDSGGCANSSHDGPGLFCQKTLTLHERRKVLSSGTNQFRNSGLATCQPEMRTALNPFRSLPYIRMYGKMPRSFFLSCMLRIDRVSVAIRRCQSGRACRASTGRRHQSKAHWRGLRHTGGA